MKINNNLFSLKNKVILITGAGRGIGQHLAEKIAEQSAIVYAIDKQFTKKMSKNSMKNLFKILTFIFIVAGFLISREKSLNSSKIAITLKVNNYYFDY